MSKRPQREPVKPPRRLYQNKAPETVPAGAPRDAVKLQFARKLQALLTDRGWNQSDLARAASKQIAHGKFSRDNVSNYIRGLVLPTPLHLKAIADALGVATDALLSGNNAPGAERNLLNPPLDVKEMGDGRAWLKVNQAVDWPVAMAIMKLLKGEK